MDALQSKAPRRNTRRPGSVLKTARAVLLVRSPHPGPSCQTALSARTRPWSSTGTASTGAMEVYVPA